MTDRSSKDPTQGLQTFESEVERQGDPMRKAYLAVLVDYLAKAGGRNAVNVLEVGSWAGASAITWARAIKECGLVGRVLCVDFWRPYFDLNVNSGSIYQEMNTAAADGRILDQFRNNLAAAKVADIVGHIVGDSKVVLPGLEHGHYDIVYLDGSHFYEDVSADISNAVPLLADGGILCGDDFELCLAEVSQDAHRVALNTRVDYTEDPSTRKSYHPGVTQAVADIIGEVSSWHGVWSVKKKGRTWEKIDLTGFSPKVPAHLQRWYSATPVLVGSYRSFNIVRYGDAVLGCRQSLGNIDLSGVDLEELKRRCRPEDLIIRDTPDDVHAEIDHLEVGVKHVHEPWYVALLRKFRRPV